MDPNLGDFCVAASSNRTIWKGAIAFGLVHIPVGLHPAVSQQDLDFDWLDQRTMDPVGYKRINKKTGKEISKENIVKGIEYEKGRYVVVSADEIEAAYPKTTRTIEIEAFVDAHEVPFIYLERPYYIAPINQGAKVYALLREVLLKTGKVGIARVVIQTRQHLALLMPCGPALVLNLIRWGDEIRTWDDLSLPAKGRRAAGLTDKEIKMGEQLIADMSAPWKPESFVDEFKAQILKLVQDKAEAGDVEHVAEPSEEEPAGGGATIYDLTELLRRSLDRSSGKAWPAARKPARKAATKATKSTKSAAKSAKPDKAAKKATVKRKAG